MGQNEVLFCTYFGPSFLAEIWCFFCLKRSKTPIIKHRLNCKPEVTIGLSNDEIARLRRENDWTQDQLGAMLGISGKAASKWERGLSKPCDKNQTKLVELFGLSIDKVESDGKPLNPIWSIALSFFLIVKNEMLRIIPTAVTFAAAYCYFAGYLSTATTVVAIGLSAGSSASARS